MKVIQLLNNLNINTMNRVSFLSLCIIGYFVMSFVPKTYVNFKSGENWYLCTNCCKTKKATSAPWENGCSSGQHNFQFCGKAGDYNITCRKCNAEVYLTSSQGPSASKCCSGGTHTWYHK